MCQKTCKALPRNALHVFADAVFTYKMYIKCKGKFLRASSFFAMPRKRLQGYLYLGKPVALILPVPDPVDIALAYLARYPIAVILDVPEKPLVGLG